MTYTSTRAPRMILAGAAAFAMAVLSTGCPEETIGEKIGGEVDDAKSALEDTFTRDGPLEEAGEALDGAAEDVKSQVEDATK